MVYRFEFQRPSYYNPRLYSWYYPTVKSNRSSSQSPFNAARYYKPYWSYNPYSSYSSTYPYNYRPYRSNYYDYYDLPSYTYRYISPKLPSLSEILASNEIDRFKHCVRATSAELDNYNFKSYNASKERLLHESRATRASSVPRFVRESSLAPSFNKLRSSLERDFF